MKKGVKAYAADALRILSGCILYAAGISLFLDPNQLAPGGVSGAAIILSPLVGLNTGTLVLLINVPLLCIGAWKLGMKLLISTVLATTASSLMMNYMAQIGPLTTDPLLAAAAGGVLVGCGMGLVFKARATTGGTDIIVRLIRLKYKHIKTGRLFIMTDSVIILASAIAFGSVDRALYAAISVFVFSMVFDTVLYGADSAKLVYIITEAEREISQKILDLDIGITYLKGIGAYTGSEKCVILCAMRKQMLPQVQDVVKQEDPQAFLIVTSATEIFGEGFKDHYGQIV